MTTVSLPHRHGPVRCLDAKDTVMAMQEYIRYIEKNIETIDHNSITVREIAILVNKTTNEPERARIFRPFEGR